MTDTNLLSEYNQLVNKPVQTHEESCLKDEGTLLKEQREAGHTLVFTVSVIVTFVSKLCQIGPSVNV